MTAESYRCLGHTFSAVAERRQDRDAIMLAFARFRTEEPAQVAYTLERLEDGRYALKVDGAVLRFSSDPNECFDMLLWRVGEQAVLGDHGMVVLHAGAVVAGDGRALLLPGRSGSGKSTTTLALVRAGWPYLSDEFASLDPADGRVHAVPRPIAVKAGTRALLPQLDDLAVVRPSDASTTVHVPPERLGKVGTSAAVGWLVFPTVRTGEPTGLTPMSRAEALMELSRSAFRFDEQHADALPVLASVARGASAWRLSMSDVDSAVDVIRGLVWAPPALP